MNKNEYNLIFFTYIREEVNKRIDVHYKLVLAKFALAGGLFAFLLSQGAKIDISAFIIASIFSYLIDIIILENLGWIRSAGYFIKQNVENTDRKIIKWESDFTQVGGTWSCFSVPGYLFGVWVIAPALMIAAFVFDFEPKNKPEVFMFVLAAYLTAYTVYLIFKNLGHQTQIKIQERESPIECEPPETK